MDDRARNEEISLLADTSNNTANRSLDGHDISSETTAPPNSSLPVSDDLADHAEERLNGKPGQPTASESNPANSTAIVSNDAGTHIVTLPASDANTTAVPILVSATEVFEAPSSVDSDTGIDPGKKKPRSFLEMFMPWKIELIAAAFALALLICETSILVHYDRKFLFEHWPHGWKINAVFAFLITFLEAAVAFYVGACIGQLRWYWFKKKQHRLDWLEIMTEARQPPGAMQLIFRRGMQKQFAVFGALIVILLLGVSTFTQNVIEEIIEPFPLGPSTASVPINTNYTWRDTDTTFRLGTQQPLPQMVAAIQNGFYTFTTAQTSLGVSAWTYCYGDTCNFGKYQSLAVCSQCAETSSFVNNPCPKGNCSDTDYYTLTNGVDVSLKATNGVLNMTSDTKYPTHPDLASVAGPLIVRFHAIVANSTGLNITGTGASATECAAWWCVNTYSGRVVNGTLEEDLIVEWTDKSDGAKTTYFQKNNIELQPPQCFVNNTSPKNESFCTFTAGAFAQVALQNFLAVEDDSTPFEPFLTGSAVYRGHGIYSTWNYTTQLAGGLVSADTRMNVVLDNLHTGFNKMAKQMTVSIRGELASDYSSEFSWGDTFYREQMFHVRWGWLVYPIALVVLSLLFLFITIFKTRNQEIWKTSILPMIFHAFGGVDHDKFVKLDTVEEMKAASRGHKVYLGEKGGHTVFHAGPTARQHRHRYEITQASADGAGHLLEIGSRAVS